MAAATAGAAASGGTDGRGRARSMTQDVWQPYRALRNKGGAALAVMRQASIAWKEADFRLARSRFEEALAIWRDLGHKLRIRECVESLGRLAQSEGDHPSARCCFIESLALAREL